MQRGWIKVWRKLQDDEIWMNPEPFNKRDAWVDLLLMTWAKDKTFIIGNRAVKLEPGQIFLAYRFLCSKWHWSKGKLKDYLDLLASPEIKKIIYKSTHDGTLVTILKWETYQGIFEVDRTPTNTPTGLKPDVNRTPTGQNKECIKKVKEVKTKPSSCSRNSKPEFLERVEKLKSLILQNNPNAKPKTADWANNVRLMVERDKRTLADIDEIIEFSQKDSFWKTNVLSMGAVKKQFDKLTMQMKQVKGSDPSWEGKYK